MAGLCDNCGKEYFVSCHDCMHILTMLYLTLKKVMVLIPAHGPFGEAREHIRSFFDFYEKKVIANSVTAKEI